MTCPLVEDLNLHQFAVDTARWKSTSHSLCVAHTPNPGPPALTVHLSKPISLPTVTHPKQTLLSVREQGGELIKCVVNVSHDGGQ